MNTDLSDVFSLVLMFIMPNESKAWCGWECYLLCLAKPDLLDGHHCPSLQTQDFVKDTFRRLCCQACRAAVFYSGKAPKAASIESSNVVLVPVCEQHGTQLQRILLQEFRL